MFQQILQRLSADEAVRLLNTAIERDPLNAGLYWAEAAFRRVLQISPTFVSE